MSTNLPAYTLYIFNLSKATFSFNNRLKSIITVREMERERQREKEREREIEFKFEFIFILQRLERQTDRQRHRLGQRDTHSNRQTEKNVETATEEIVRTHMQ